VTNRARDFIEITQIEGCLRIVNRSKFDIYLYNRGERNDDYAFKIIMGPEQVRIIEADYIPFTSPKNPYKPVIRWLDKVRKYPLSI